MTGTPPVSRRVVSHAGDAASARVGAIAAQVAELRDAVRRAERDAAALLATVHPAHRRSAANLVHYVAFRGHDLRSLQAELSEMGLSSLGRSEAHVAATVDAVLAVLDSLRAGDDERPSSTSALGADFAAVSPAEGRALLWSNTVALFGEPTGERDTWIMVTLPGESADEPDLIRDCASAGMDVARINCAHDDEPTWARMVDHVRSAPRTPSAPRIAMDLAGPKLRTGPLAPGPNVRRVAPRRDAFGRVLEPAVVRLVAGDPPPRAPRSRTLHLPCDPAWVARRSVGEPITLVDTRDAHRQWTVAEVGAGWCDALVDHTTYVATGTELRVGDDRSAVGDLPPLPIAHRVHPGERLVLTRSLDPAPRTPPDAWHRVGCTLPEVFLDVRPGQRIWFDDGKIGGVVDEVSADEIVVELTDVAPRGANLRGGKGINLPDTDLVLDALTAKDLADLPFVAAHADIVNLSFVRRAEDVEHLQRELAALGAEHLGIVLKIENAAAFEHLPELLLAAMRSERVGVMIARGDLAVELGFERLAEVQEEILWICEAAHVPVIWATQVLDTLARTGRPSRAEVTDAAMADRAECVMLNKGPYIVRAIEALDSILWRMQHHQHKKRSLLRRLRSWQR
jgi:pyruvate kinase